VYRLQGESLTKCPAGQQNCLAWMDRSNGQWLVSSHNNSVFIVITTVITTANANWSCQKRWICFEWCIYSKFNHEIFSARELYL